MPGVAVVVLREALNLMQFQGETVVTMIQSAGSISSAAAGSTAQPASGDVAVQTVTDPLVAQNVDLFA